MSALHHQPVVVGLAEAKGHVVVDYGPDGCRSVRASRLDRAPWGAPSIGYTQEQIRAQLASSDAAPVACALPWPRGLVAIAVGLAWWWRNT